MADTFVVTLASHDTAWTQAFRDESARIATALHLESEDIEHIGSTAVPELDAKPFIDILVGTVSLDDMDPAEKALADLGYVVEGRRPGHGWLCWPEPANRRFIIHLVVRGGDVWNARISFRDALRGDSDLRDRYRQLKVELAERHASDLTAYTHGKRDFVAAVLRDHAS